MTRTASLSDGDADGHPSHRYFRFTYNTSTYVDHRTTQLEGFKVHSYSRPFEWPCLRVSLPACHGRCV